MSSEGRMDRCAWVRVSFLGYATSCGKRLMLGVDYDYCPGCGMPLRETTGEYSKAREKREEETSQDNDNKLEVSDHGSYDCMGGSDSLYNRRMSR